MTHLDPSSAAYWTIIALCLVLMGALLTAGPVTIEQRGTVLGGIFAVLAFVGWRYKRGRSGRDDE